ncbi:MAG: hypothetical protein ACFE9L_11370 [Candidatus Hodarchaeota archaeon]
MISLEYKYNINYDEIIEIEKALKTIELAKGLKVNLRNEKRTKVFYDIVKMKFNFNIVKKGDMSVFVTKETLNDIQRFLSPIIHEFKKSFITDFKKGKDLINEVKDNSDFDLRIEFVTEKINCVYDLTKKLELSLNDYDLIWCLKNLLTEISTKKFPILISELGYPIKRNKLRKFIKTNLIFFNIISESFSERSVDEKLCKELYHLLIKEKEPRIRRYIVKKILEYDKRSFEIVYRERIPNKSSIRNIFIKNWKKKGLAKFQAEQLYELSIKKKSEFLNLLNNAYFSDLGNIITNRNNWNIFETPFTIFNLSKNEISKKFINVNLVRNRIVHIIEEKSGKFNILEELTEFKISMNDILEFCFGLDQILR